MHIIHILEDAVFVGIIVLVVVCLLGAWWVNSTWGTGK